MVRDPPLEVLAPPHRVVYPAPRLIEHALPGLQRVVEHPRLRVQRQERRVRRPHCLIAFLEH